ncbi:hypothetical protein ASA1KI_42930 [Opitutales bacterium ASA1]|nr:hypothetical protein ASA1KI_42930 [Opitutales bacterium ASA1]
MSHATNLDSALDAAEALTLDEQEELLVTLRRRIADRRRTQISRDVRSARLQHRHRKTAPKSVDQIMDALLAPEE